ncbi:type IV pilin [Halosimplex salinum]|uniref:type IV pilin n=1 Tax=Halosimplex salinum TaxID=1710538 RepID=UPI000F4A8F75|nr:type IV pilin N-terminal domain-containing protein [Halosimplex salinum]
MQLKQLLDDDDAVSPVIGVILMVAITVILAAVIASFVLGLGNQTSQGAPTATIGMDYTEIDENSGSGMDNWGVVKVSHNGGESISEDEVYVRGTGFNASGTHCSASDGNLCTPPGASDILEDYIINEGGSQIHHIDSGVWNGTASGDDSKLVSGDRAGVYVASDYEISVVYQSQEGDTSSTLNEQAGPDA